MTAVVTDEQKAQALDLHLAGMTVPKIAERVEITPTQVKRIIKAAIAEQVPDTELTDEARTQIARLDAMHFGLWPQARRGNFEAVDRVLAIDERRDRVATPKKNTHELRTAFDKSIETSKEIAPVDAGLVALGRQYADRIDEAIAYSKGEELTKALYLGPHILGVLKEALATPAARAAAAKSDGEVVSGKLAQLRSITGSKRSGGSGTSAS